MYKILHQKVDINKLCRKERASKRPVANQTPCKVEVINNAEYLNTKYAEAYPALHTAYTSAWVSPNDFNVFSYYYNENSRILTKVLLADLT
jgi:Fe-S cluster assembly ATPase SufC